MALENIQLNKSRVTQTYNKCIKKKEFKEGDLVWKTLLIKTKGLAFGKWSPNWEGLLFVSQVILGGAYRLINIQGQKLGKALNGKFLKKYYSSV